MQVFKRLLGSATIRVFVAIATLPLMLSCSEEPGKDSHNYSGIPERLLAESSENPIHVHNTSPRLSWRSQVQNQSAFQIQVATGSDLLVAGEPDLWDSGKVVSGESLNILYTGKTLSSRQRAFWRVRVWEAGVAAPGQWSEIAEWEMGLLENSAWVSDWIQAGINEPVQSTDAIEQWVELAGTTMLKDGQPQHVSKAGLRAMTPAALFRKDFSVKGVVKRARLYSAGAGYLEIYIDGNKIGDRVMNPGQTDFDARILYDVDAVESLLSPGKHTLAAHLGQGWYAESVAFQNSKFYFGQPALIAQLEIEYTTGEVEVIKSDESWVSRPSPIIKNSIFAGEVYDARLYDPNWAKPVSDSLPASWKPVRTLTDWPTNSLEAQILPRIKRMREVKPVTLFQPEPDVWVFDFGQNFTGVPTLSLEGAGLPAGSPIYLRYAEWADEHGNISQMSGGGFATKVNQVDAYITQGSNAETWRPTFTWHGFRYIEVRGLKRKPELNMFSAELVRSSVKTIGKFESSDPHLNRVHSTALWTYESNLMSLPMDCPIRERAGWTGDAHASLTTSNYNFDMGLLWEKYLGDFKTSPHVAPAIVPGRRSFGGKLDWAVGEIFIAWEHYLHHADESLLESQYDSLIEYMEFAAEQSSNWLFKKGYGDWCDPVRTPGTPREGGRGIPQNTPPPITSTALLAKASDIMSRISGLVGESADQEKYREWYLSIRNAFHDEFYNDVTGHYGSQTADAMALQFGLVPELLVEQVAEQLNQDVVENWSGHASVGALGHRWLYPALGDHGYANTALETFFAKGHPGFYYLFDELNGTSLWERKGAFDPKSMDAPQRSLSHPFQSGYDAWFYQGLGGIRPDSDNPGFKHFFLQPVFPERLDWVKVDFESGYGMIRSHWRKRGEVLEWQVTVPPNTSSTVKLPGMEPDGVTLLPGVHTYEISLR